MVPLPRMHRFLGVLPHGDVTLLRLITSRLWEFFHSISNYFQFRIFFFSKSFFNYKKNWLYELLGSSRISLKNKTIIISWGRGIICSQKACDDSAPSCCLLSCIFRQEWLRATGSTRQSGAQYACSLWSANSSGLDKSINEFLIKCWGWCLSVLDPVLGNLQRIFRISLLSTFRSWEVRVKNILICSLWLVFFFFLKKQLQLREGET